MIRASLEVTPEIKLLNFDLLLLFGEVMGKQRFKWITTDQLFYDEFKDYEEFIDPVTGISAIQTRFERKSVASKMGLAGWCLAQHTPNPTSEYDHWQAVGNSLHYMAVKYEEVGNTLLALTDVPDKGLQDEVIVPAIYRALTTTQAQFLQLAIDWDKEQIRRKKSERESLIMDMLPAYLGDGTRSGHVSFPSKDSQIIIARS